jgi:hypothetical protein
VESILQPTFFITFEGNKINLTMKFYLHFFAVAITLCSILSSCEPGQKQLAKEKERTETTIKEGIEPMQKEIESLKNQIKSTELKSELALAQIKLENIQQPTEIKTQGEQSNEVSNLTTKIEELQNAITNLSAESTASTIDSTAKK